MGETHKQVVFEVLPDATKAEIKAAVELLFKEQKVEVAAVNVVNVEGKEKRHGRFIGRRKAVKKAYVSLQGRRRHQLRGREWPDHGTRQRPSRPRRAAARW